MLKTKQKSAQAKHLPAQSMTKGLTSARPAAYSSKSKRPAAWITPLRVLGEAETLAQRAVREGEAGLTEAKK